jgi:hypothetical protein
MSRIDADKSTATTKAAADDTDEIVVELLLMCPWQ